jgi:hypothetical protein
MVNDFIVISWGRSGSTILSLYLKDYIDFKYNIDIPLPFSFLSSHDRRKRNVIHTHEIKLLDTISLNYKVLFLIRTPSDAALSNYISHSLSSTISHLYNEQFLNNPKKYFSNNIIDNKDTAVFLQQAKNHTKFLKQHPKIILDQPVLESYRMSCMEWNMTCLEKLKEKKLNCQIIDYDYWIGDLDKISSLLNINIPRKTIYPIKKNDSWKNHFNNSDIENITLWKKINFEHDKKHIDSVQNHDIVIMKGK